MKYKIKTGRDLKNAIADLGFNQSSLNRFFQHYCDNYNLESSLRRIQRNVNKKDAPEPYFVIIINLLAELKERDALPQLDTSQNDETHLDRYVVNR